MVLRNSCLFATLSGGRDDVFLQNSGAAGSQLVKCGMENGPSAVGRHAYDFQILVL